MLSAAGRGKFSPQIAQIARIGSDCADAVREDGGGGCNGEIDIESFLCYGRIIVELKALSRLDSSHENQILHYLKATGLRLGLLYNFGNSNGLEIKRLVFN